MTERKRPREGGVECFWRDCCETFTTVNALFTHVKEMHVTVKGPCLWHDCEYFGKTKQLLQTHMRTHTGEKPYKCDVCDKAFTQLGHLETHMRTHTGEKPYKCDVCDYACAKSGDLTTHMRTHTGEKPYKCKLCDKAFAHSDVLTKHMRTHTGEKPYKCDVCDYACARSGDLTTHMRTHTGEKPYKCKLCDKAFSMSCSLINHMRTHTGEKPYKCDTCDKDFSESGSLKSHTLRQHIGPWCVICGESWVPDETMLCGRCNRSAKYGEKERRFFDFIYQYDDRLAQVCFTLRDQAMGCGVNKRPDGLMQLQTKAACVDIEAAMETTIVEDEYRVKLIIEADEHQHQAYNASCELVRLQQIQERDNDAVYVLRYNVDQPDAFAEKKLAAFCERIIAVLEGDFVKAIESITLFEVEYFGYTDNRRVLLETEMRQQFGY